MKRLISSILLLLCISKAEAFISSVKSVTAQQAIIQYTNANTCTVQISQNPSFSPLAYDVDPTLFTNANQDNRGDDITNGTSHMVVVGRRKSEQALDGISYSRSLQAATSYYYQVTCGVSISSGTFVTGNPQLGNQYPLMPPFQAGRFGNYGWPQINWSDQSKMYVDPTTGLGAKRITSPGWMGAYNDPIQFMTAIDTASVWTNVTNSTNGTSTNLASYSGTGGQPIFLPFNPSQLRGPQGVEMAFWYDDWTIDDIMVRTFGQSSTSSTIMGCMSADSGQTCLDAPVVIATMTAALENPTTTYPNLCVNTDTGTNCFPNMGWWGGWNFTPRKLQISAMSGTVNVSGDSVTYTGGAIFDILQSTGSRFYVAGSSPACTNNLCTIASIQNSTQLVLKESPGALTNANYQAANSGLKLWVSTSATTQNVSLSVNMGYAYSMQTYHGEGYFSICNQNQFPVTLAADGVTAISPVMGQLCFAQSPIFSTYFVIFMFIPSTGESRLITPVYISNQGDAPLDQAGVNYPYMIGEIFSSTDPYKLYSANETGGGLSTFQAVYSTTTGHFKTYGHSLYPNSSYFPGEDTTGGFYLAPAWTDTGITWTNIQKASQGLSMDQQIAAFDVLYDTQIFTPSALVGFTNGRSVSINRTVTDGETIALYHAFDLSTGLLRQSANTWLNYPARWGSSHSQLGIFNWQGLIENTLGGTYNFEGSSEVIASNGFIFTPTSVLKNGTFSADTSLTISSPADVCPIIPSYLQNIVPANPVCITFQSPMACNTKPYPREAVDWPCEYNSAYSELSQMAVGDGFSIDNGSFTVGQYQEMLLIVSSQSLGGGSYQFTAVRNAIGNTISAANNGWRAVMLPPATRCPFSVQGCTPGTGEWFDASSSGPFVNWVLDPGAFGGHPDLGSGPTPGFATFCQTNGCRYNTPFIDQVNQGLNSFASANFYADGAFNGQAGSMDLQGYPSVHQLSASPTEKQWVLNYRHLNPSDGVGEEFPSAIAPVAYSLLAGTTNVYQFTSINGGLNYKSNPTVSWAGPNLLKDVSSPVTGNVITDTGTWQYCIALNSNECRTGSTAGQGYVSVPTVNQNLSTSSGQYYGTYCVSNWYDDNLPCIGSPPPRYAQGTQQDASRQDPLGVNWRSLGMAFDGPGRQFQFSAFTPEPTGQWLFAEGVHLDGVRSDLIAVQNPGWPVSQDKTTNKTQYVNVPVSISSYSAAVNVRLSFGYAENGSPSSFYCTPRSDTCEVNGTVPFAYASESPSFVNCASGCTLEIPAIPGRTLYYEIDRKDAGGHIYLGDIKITQVP